MTGDSQMSGSKSLAGSCSTQHPAYRRHPTRCGTCPRSRCQIVYLPADTYLNEGIQTYTEFLNDFADALESAKRG